MHIKTDIEITHHDGGKHSFTARPSMGVIKHFPTHVCLAMIEKGAVEVGKKKSSKEVAEEPAK